MDNQKNEYANSKLPKKQNEKSQQFTKSNTMSNNSNTKKSNTSDQESPLQLQLQQQQSQSQNATIKLHNCFDSVTKEWKSFDINPKLIDHLTNFMHLNKPTRIQSLAIPYILNERDVLLQSETGSGKTLAYLIPIVNELSMQLNARDDGTKALIISPTRELTIQIHQVLQILLRKIPFIVPGMY